MKQFHEVANLFPLMSAEEFAALKQDIADNGLREAVWLHADGSIIDGRNRYKACTELGIEPEYRTWKGEGSLVTFVVSLNLHRRHLSSGQRAVVGLDMLPLLEEEARERQKGGQGGVLLDQKIDQASGEKRAPQATAQAATIVNTNRQYISDAKAIQEAAPELIADIRAGELNIPQAKQLANMPEERRADVRKKMKEMGTDKVVKAARAVTQEKKKDAPPLPDAKYRVIYADPPWSYGNEMVNTTRPNDYYPLMSTPDICALPVKELADKDAVLFLWTTSPHLPESLDVIDAWGFEYKTSFVWDKVKHNMGHYNSVRHEFLFVCLRGSCPPDVQKLFDSVQSIERTEHSVKPEKFREIIDTLYTHGRKIELFARRPAPGWEVWGNEAQWIAIPNGNRILVEYGIQNENSDLRAHVSVTAQKVYVFPTTEGQRAIESGLYRLREAKQGEIVTARGYTVPVSAIHRLTPVSIPEQLMGMYRILNSDSTTQKGNKAVAIVQTLLRWGWFPLPIDSTVVSDIKMQRQGLDLIVAGRFRIQVKCDYSAGENGTGNLYLQTHECNPYKMS